MSATNEGKKKSKGRSFGIEEADKVKEGSHASPRANIETTEQNRDPNSGSPNNLEVLVGLNNNEGGKEGYASRYTSVPRNEKSATDVSVARLENINVVGIPSGVNSPVQNSIEEGTGMSAQKPKHLRIEELEMQESGRSQQQNFGNVVGIQYICQKPGCRLTAYGRCQWKNPCSLPEKKGGCNDLFCELHACSQLDNFRRYQCCHACYELFMSARKWRQKARVYSFVIIVLVLALIGISATYFVVSAEDNNRAVPQEENIFTEVFTDVNGMTEEISRQWGLRAHVRTNTFRKAAGYEALEWSDQMHQIAYGRCQDVANGVIPFGQTNFINLIGQTRTIYSPKAVDSFSEQMAKIVNVYSMEEDYVSEWEDAWTIDHQTDIIGDFNVSTTSVYFNEPEYEIIIIQLFADVVDVKQTDF